MEKGTTMIELEARHVTKTYGNGQSPAVRDVNFTLQKGESVAIMGPSGSGKSTFLHLLAGLFLPTSGEILFEGRPYSQMSEGKRTQLRRTAFGFVFQSGQLLPELPAVENAALPLMLGGMDRMAAVARARQWCEALGLREQIYRRPGELSGGQAQRVAIARALALQPRVIFADEPTGALDRKTGHETMQLLTSFAQRSGASLIVVTHDPTVAQFCHHTLNIVDGQLIDGRQPASVQSQPMQAQPVQPMQQVSVQPLQPMSTQPVQTRYETQPIPHNSMTVNENVITPSTPRVATNRVARRAQGVHNFSFNPMTGRWS